MSSIDNDQQFFIERARDDLVSFSIYTDIAANNPYKAYNPKPYHELIAENLMKVYRWEIKKLMISVPPQFWKSQLASINFPAWVLWNSPDVQFVLASYWASLSEAHSTKCRDLIRQPNYKQIFGDILKEDSQAKWEWFTKKWWRYTWVWIWGWLTWKPVDIGMIDDAIKDMEEANSDTMLDKHWDWYNSVFLSRLHWESKQILIMTRWSEKDLCWRILEIENDWTVINIPCWDDNHVSIRPERHPTSLLEAKQKADPRIFQSLYLWDPIWEWTGIFKREYFEYYERSEIIVNWEYSIPLEIVTFIDPAISQKQTADNTAIVTIWLDRENNFIYVIDVDRWKYLPDEIIDRIFQKVMTYKPSKVWIETNQYQKMLELELRKQMRLRNRPFLLEWIPSLWEKEAKIKTNLQPKYSNHMILHMKHWENVGELENEALKFPNGKHDDMIDCLASAIKLLDWFTGDLNKVVSQDRTWWEKDVLFKWLKESQPQNNYYVSAQR